jgi:hypothetical protein
MAAAACCRCWSQRIPRELSAALGQAADACALASHNEIRRVDPAAMTFPVDEALSLRLPD